MGQADTVRRSEGRARPGHVVQVGVRATACVVVGSEDPGMGSRVGVRAGRSHSGLVGTVAMPGGAEGGRGAEVGGHVFTGVSVVSSGRRAPAKVGEDLSCRRGVFTRVGPSHVLARGA